MTSAKRQSIQTMLLDVVNNERREASQHGCRKGGRLRARNSRRKLLHLPTTRGPWTQHALRRALTTRKTDSRDELCETN